jgi:hypothetical protein
MDYSWAWFWLGVSAKPIVCGKAFTGRGRAATQLAYCTGSSGTREDAMRGKQRASARRAATMNKTVGRKRRRASLLAAAAVLAGTSVLGPATPALAQGSAPGAPGANATWNESNVQGRLP